MKVANWRADQRRLALRQAAMQYVARGWQVIPASATIAHEHVCERFRCQLQNSHPAFDNWQQVATCDMETIVSWWSKRSYNVALSTGDVIDIIEVTHDLGRIAVELLDARKAGRLGPVAVSSGGRRLFFVAAGEPLCDELAEHPGVQLRARDNWVPAPPSRLSFGQIRWQLPPSPISLELPQSHEVQQALVDALAWVTPHPASPRIH